MAMGRSDPLTPHSQQEKDNDKVNKERERG